MKQIKILTLILILLPGCNPDKKDKIIPKKDLVNILIDLHKADALATNQKINDYYGGLDSTLLYGSIFEKYGYTKDDLTKTIKYYSGRPEDISEIYNDVFSSLSKQAEDIRAYETKYSYSNVENFWRNPKRISVTGDTTAYPEPFVITVDTVGTYIINMNIKMLRVDESENPRIEAYFYNHEDPSAENRVYFKSIPITKSKYTRDYILIKELKDKSLNRLFITVPKVDNADNNFYKELKITSFNVQKLREKENKKKILKKDS